MACQGTPDAVLPTKKAIEVRVSSTTKKQRNSRERNLYLEGFGEIHGDNDVENPHGLLCDHTEPLSIIPVAPLNQIIEDELWFLLKIRSGLQLEARIAPLTGLSPDTDGV